jgi:CheY-like chemotaxis protein
MKKILLCSSNRILARSLYGMLRDEGHEVEDVEHPSLAVRKVLEGPYDLTVFDAEPFGMSAADAARIVGEIAPGMPVLKVLDGAYDFTIIDAEPFGLSAEDAAQVIRAIAPGMPILCIGGGPGYDHLHLIKLPADLAAIRELLHVIAA